MHDIGHRLELDALRVPTAVVSVTVLALGTVLLGALAYAAGHESAAASRAILRYGLPIGAITIIAITLNLRRLLQALEVAQRHLGEQAADARFLALHHALSQLPNRRYCIQLLRERLIAAQQDPTCLALIRIDGFTALINASGHRAADRLAVQIGPRLASILRPGDLLAHLAADLFAVARSVRSAGDSEELRASITTALNPAFDMPDGRVQFAASIGMATADRGETDPEDLIEAADRDMRTPRAAPRS